MRAQPGHARLLPRSGPSRPPSDPGDTRADCARWRSPRTPQYTPQPQSRSLSTAAPHIAAAAAPQGCAPPREAARRLRSRPHAALPGRGRRRRCRCRCSPALRLLVLKLELARVPNLHAKVTRASHTATGRFPSQPPPLPLAHTAVYCAVACGLPSAHRPPAPRRNAWRGPPPPPVSPTHLIKGGQRRAALVEALLPPRLEPLHQRHAEAHQEHARVDQVRQHACARGKAPGRRASGCDCLAAVDTGPPRWLQKVRAFGCVARGSTRSDRSGPLRALEEALCAAQSSRARSWARKLAAHRVTRLADGQGGRPPTVVVLRGRGRGLTVWVFPHALRPIEQHRQGQEEPLASAEDGEHKHPVLVDLRRTRAFEEAAGMGGERAYARVADVGALCRCMGLHVLQLAAGMPARCSVHAAPRVTSAQ
jgi:hypothetical protein